LTITINDISLIFGYKNIQGWSQLDNDQSCQDDDRIERAIEYAEEYVEYYFKGFTLPEDSVIINDWKARLAGIWLFESRFTETSEELMISVERMKQNTIDTMKQFRESSFPNFSIKRAVDVYEEE